MFTGIIQKIGIVQTISGLGMKRLVLKTPFGFLRGAKIGASIALDGVCLTLVKKSFRRAEFDIMSETLKLTTLGNLKVGDRVNLERSFKVGDEIGGHILSGHISEKAKIISIETKDDTTSMRFQFSKEYTDLVANKGFIALNGASLTVSEYNSDSAEFSIFFIPETLNKTTFSEKKVGDFVNIEYYQK
jgi:riboflavin synthase